MSMVCESITSGASSDLRIFSATLRGELLPTPEEISTANSSPPRRATTSESRSAVRTRVPTSRSARSPTGWPSVSLIALKRSMSKSSTDSSVPWRRAFRSACSSWRWNIARFGSPVRPSS